MGAVYNSELIEVELKLQGLIRHLTHSADDPLNVMIRQNVRIWVAKLGETLASMRDVHAMHAVRQAMETSCEPEPKP